MNAVIPARTQASLPNEELLGINPPATAIQPLNLRQVGPKTLKLHSVMLDRRKYFVKRHLLP
jgi:hypothetical protein